jgi:hypothetical protein
MKIRENKGCNNEIISIKCSWKDCTHHYRVVARHNLGKACEAAVVLEEKEAWVRVVETKTTTLVALIIVGFIIIIGAAFVLGTVVGFNTAMNSLSSCEQRPCTTLGVNASSCEVCKESQGYKILRVR